MSECKEPHLCKKCKKDSDELLTLSAYSWYTNYVNYDDWYCEVCFSKWKAKLDKKIEKELNS